MIRSITSILNEAVTALPVGERIPFAEVIEGVPSVHAGNGQFVPIIADAQGGVSYWRAGGARSISKLEQLAACGDAVRVSVPLVLVAFVRREQCDAPDALLNTTAHQISASLRAVRDGIQGAFSVGVGNMSLGVDVARTSEVPGFVVPASIVVLTLSVTVQVDLSAECLNQCGEPYDLLCALIGKAPNARVVGCLGPQRVAQICDSTPCDPTTVNGEESDTRVITVTQGGNPVGTLNPATGVVTIEPCEPVCAEPFTIKWDVGGNIIDIAVFPNPCGGEGVLACDYLIDAVVVDGAGSPEANGLYLRDGDYNGYPLYVNRVMQIRTTNPPPLAGYTIFDTVGDVGLYGSIGENIEVLPPWGYSWQGIDGNDPAPTVRQATLADLCPCSKITAVPLSMQLA